MTTLTSSSFTSTLNLGFRIRPNRTDFTRFRHYDRRNYGYYDNNSCVLSSRDVLSKSTVRIAGLVDNKGFIGGFECYASGNDGGGGNREDGDTANESNLTEVDSDKPVVPPGVMSSGQPTFSPDGLTYNNFQVDSFKLMELLGPEKVDPVDVKLIKDKLFGYSTFWVTKEEPFGDFGEGILFLGNLRGNREDVFAKLQSQLAEIMGDKYNLFMVEEPNSENPDPRGGPRVSFGMLRKEVSEPGPTTLWQYVIAVLLFVLTIGSSVELGIASQIQMPLNHQICNCFIHLLNPLCHWLMEFWVFSYFIVHPLQEVGHFLAAFPKNVKLSIPFFIPNITLGSFGAITQFKSILPDRKTKVDISLAGPFAGAALSLSMFAVGLLLSLKPEAAADMVQVPSMLFQGSLLLGLISRATLGYTALHGATVSIHPLVIAGWCGLTTSAFNMLPIGCLDGGRVVQGAFGKDALVGFGLTTYLLLGLGVLGGPLSLPWGLYVLICQRSPEKPCLNDVTEVGTWRRTAVTVAIFLVVLILLPVWDELAEELGIGLVTTF
ncbi:probable zinc metalloprotease EGY1, chloroplastic isoform X3 [Helianthus annuus]|uniref:probable zinc metalloprotease EGY1, chloroplastic isoform X3 n=1 Tax=Helianthus annuus TaxID=4232 RepID=UPI001652C593|nr:probable zinc metalloprotease EGY1, chloroplastic isoform X3 [Helianthus annuus]